MDERVIKGRTPAADGYYMPAEFERHSGCILIWPARPGSWPYGARAAREAFANVIAAIAGSERVYVAAGKECIASAVAMLLNDHAERLPHGTERYVLARGMCAVYQKSDKERWRANVEIFLAETDDAWARDVAPTFVVKRKKGAAGNLEAAEPEDFTIKRKKGGVGNPGAAASLGAVDEQKKQERQVCAVNWEFNAWGGDYDGLYASWEKDNAFASFFAKNYGYHIYDASPFVLEGGSIHSDGEGTLLVTERCLLSKGRNPGLTKAEIESRLKKHTGARKVLWLPFGIYGDETNEHVDNVCAFIRPAEVVLAWTDDADDPQYPMSAADLSYLERETDARGRKITVHKLPIPRHPVCVQEKDLGGYSFAPGEDMREAGERLAASYVNFYFSNNAVVMPVFGGENTESDRLAVAIMERLNPGRRVVPVSARDILVGGGNIHCITQQIPV